MIWRRVYDQKVSRRGVQAAVRRLRYPPAEDFLVLLADAAHQEELTGACYGLPSHLLNRVHNRVAFTEGSGLSNTGAIVFDQVRSLLNEEIVRGSLEAKNSLFVCAPSLKRSNVNGEVGPIPGLGTTE